MNLFNKKLDIYEKDIMRQVTIGSHQMEVVIEGAQHATVKGKEVVLDEELVLNRVESMVKELQKTETKYNPLPKRLVISHKKVEEGTAGPVEKKLEIIKADAPRYQFDDVCIREGAKEDILSALTLIKYKDKLFKEWGLEETFKNGRSVVLNFYGAPGTGKSMMAEAIASYLNKKVYTVNYAELESKYVGETPKNIKKVFERAKKEDAVLVFDEADSFLGKRLTNVSQSADYGVNITRSVMLIELEKFEGVVIFTTNLLENYDEAFRRRILTNIEFELPDEGVREQIWSKQLGGRLPISESITAQGLARKYKEISGADIKDIVLFASVKALQEEKNQIEQMHFDRAYDVIKKRYDTHALKVVKHETVTKEQMEAELAK